MLAKITQFLVALGPWGILLLSFVDSLGVPISAGMDAMIILVSSKNPSMAFWCAACAVAGSAAGNISLFFIARRGGRRYLDRKEPPGKSRKFRAWFYRYGLVTVFIPALVPIPLPLKAFVILSGALRVRVLPFLAAILLARVLRYGTEAYLGLKIGEESSRFLRDHVWELVVLSIALFAALYLLVRVSDRWRRPAAESGIE